MEQSAVVLGERNLGETRASRCVEHAVESGGCGGALFCELGRRRRVLHEDGVWWWKLGFEVWEGRGCTGRLGRVEGDEWLFGEFVGFWRCCGMLRFFVNLLSYL